MVRKLVSISLFVFWAVLVSILTAGLVFKQNNITGDVTGGGNNNTGNITGGGGGVILTAAEVAKHSSANDCWLIINNKVYDVTNFLSIHPGGSGTIIPFCGQEATAAFDSKDRNPAQPHSQTADALLANYYIGKLGQAVPPQNVTQPPPANPPGNTGGRGERDD